MMKPTLTLLTALRLAPLAVAQGSDGASDCESWPVVIAQKSFRVDAVGIRRVGFTLPAEARGRRVVVDFSGLLDSPKPAGYSPALALEVNGEVMRLQLAGKPRLLNRPMEWPFGKARPAVQVAGKDGVLGLIENTGSARWMPFTWPCAAFSRSAECWSGWLKTGP